MHLQFTQTQPVIKLLLLKADITVINLLRYKKFIDHVIRTLRCGCGQLTREGGPVVAAVKGAVVEVVVVVGSRERGS